MVQELRDRCFMLLDHAAVDGPKRRIGARLDLELDTQNRQRFALVDAIDIGADGSPEHVGIIPMLVEERLDPRGILNPGRFVGGI